jgi:hypothetical protein
MDQPSVTLRMILAHQAVDLTLTQAQILSCFTIGHLTLLNLDQNLQTMSFLVTHDQYSFHQSLAPLFWSVQGLEY